MQTTEKNNWKIGGKEENKRIKEANFELNWKTQASYQTWLLFVCCAFHFFSVGVFRCLSYAFCKPQRIMHEFKLLLYCFSQPSGLVCVFFSSLCRHSCTHRKIGMAMHICIVWLVQVTKYIAKGVLSWIYDTFVLIN